jgi:transketolase
MPEAAKLEHLKKLAALMRYYILTMTTQAGSGHPTSSLSAVELMAGLMFGGIFRFDLDNPRHPDNDRLIFSKGHASPLFYSLYALAGKLTEADLMTYRHWDSPLEGHPTMSFRFTEAATGSLGQGLSIGLGVALNAKYLDKLPYTTYVLLGDSEMAEGSQWEAMQLAAHYKLDNLVGILDVNRLGQRGETMYGHDLMAYEHRIAAFGWETILVDGHSFPEVLAAYNQVMTVTDKPVMIIARTIKGKGISFLEDQNGWHGKPLSQEQLAKALPELGPVDKSIPVSPTGEPGRRGKQFHLCGDLPGGLPQAVFRNVHRRAKHGGRGAGPGHPGENPLCLHLRGLFLPGLRPDPHEPV